MISIILLYVIMTCHFRSTCCTAWLAVYMIDNCNRSKQSFSFHHLCRYLFFIHIFREEGTMMRNKGEQDSEAMSCPSWQARHLRATRWFKVNRNQADTPWKPSEQRQRGWQSSTKALDKPRHRSDSPAHLLARQTVAAPFSAFQHGRSFTVPAAQAIKHPYEIQNSKVVLPYGTLLWSQRLQIQFLKEGEKISMETSYGCLL